jgi:hypothetical protein
MVFFCRKMAIFFGGKIQKSEKKCKNGEKSVKIKKFPSEKVRLRV